MRSSKTYGSRGDHIEVFPGFPLITAQFIKLVYSGILGLLAHRYECFPGKVWAQKTRYFNIGRIMVKYRFHTSSITKNVPESNHGRPNKYNHR